MNENSELQFYKEVDDKLLGISKLIIDRFFDEIKFEYFSEDYEFWNSFETDYYYAIKVGEKREDHFFECIRMELMEDNIVRISDKMKGWNIYFIDFKTKEIKYSPFKDYWVSEDKTLYKLEDNFNDVMKFRELLYLLEYMGSC